MLDISISKKEFGSKVIFENTTITIQENGIYGIVGKNGEGKTTLFKCMLSLTPFEGKISFKSELLKSQKIAWCPTEPALYEELTAAEFYDFYRELTSSTSNNSKMLFDVTENQLIKNFSTGMKKKTYLNAVFQNDYPIYILDEPFNGLDLESNYILVQYLKEKSKSSIILISSHILEILYANCESIFVIKDKNIVNFPKGDFQKIEEKLFQ
ncbi:CcmA ABC-type multidrug transport system, ATPase component [Flavobacteriaceae bacterium]